MWNNARFINLIANALTVIALSAFVFAALVWLAHRPAFSLSEIVVEPVAGESLQRVSAPSVRATVAGRITGNFFTADLEAARQTFETVPWVREAMVRRHWPNALHVSVREYQPLGLWNDTQLLDIEGTPFTANQAEAEKADDQPLPVLGGPPGSGQIVRQRFAELNEWLRPLGRVPVQLTLSDRHAWRTELDNGVVLDLGRDPVSGWTEEGADEGHPQPVSVQLRVQRFVQTLRAVEQRAGRPVIYADLRYPNGFAVRLGEAVGAEKKSTSANKP